MPKPDRKRGKMNNEHTKLINNFVSCIKLAIKNENWYAALILALIMPDICGKLEHPKSNSQKRYVDWYDKYISKKYTFRDVDTNKDSIFLSGNDCYALRCSLIHEGQQDITTQTARQKLQKINFVVPKKGTNRHNMNFSNIELQLEVDRFCLDMCSAVEQWIKGVSRNQNVQNRIEKLFKIYL